jgi:hypothetical protein
VMESAGIAELAGRDHHYTLGIDITSLVPDTHRRQAI